MATLKNPKKKTAIFLIAILGATSAFADNVSGTYYEPKEDTGDGYYPETLKIFGETGRYEIHVVDHGLRTTFESTYSVQGDRVTIMPLRLVHKCNWSPPIVGQPAVLSFTRTKDSLTLSLGGDNEVLRVARPDQIMKVMAVPACSGQSGVPTTSKH